MADRSHWDLFHDPRPACSELMHPLMHDVIDKLTIASTQLNLLSGIKPRSEAVADQFGHLSTLAMELEQRMGSDDPAIKYLGVMEQEVLSGSWPLGTVALIHHRRTSLTHLRALLFG